MDAVTRPARLVVVSLAMPLLLATCTSSEAPSVATTIVITPAATTLHALGRTQRFTAAVKDQRGNPLTAAVTWSTTNAGVVTVVDTSGVATAVANGTAQVTATSGTATMGAAVTVSQVTQTITKVSGDGQSGTAGQALAAPLVAQLNDSTGHPIAGTTVTFAVATGGGSLGTATPASDANGRAQTTWTLGGPAGSQSVSASVAGATGASFGATASAGPAASVAKQAGDAQTGITGGNVATAPAVIVKDAFANPVSGVAVTFSTTAGNGTVGGGSQTTNASGIATVGSWTLGNAGTDTLTATVTGSGIAGNPVHFTATAQATGTPATVAVLVGNHQPGLVGFGVNVRPAVVVRDAANAPVPNATVTFAVTGGGGSVTGGTASTNASGVAQVGKWTLGASPGLNTLTATVTGSGITGNPQTFTDTAQAGGYTVAVQFFGPTPSAAVQAAMDSAAAKWQRIIYGPLSTVALNLAAKTACGDTTAPAINVSTPGLVIIAKFDSIDGHGQILGQAGPCLIRTSDTLSALGEMEFDTADVADMITNGTLNSVMLHEMGHVIGFGTLWGAPSKNCLQLPSGSGTPVDTYFSCAQARAEFDSLGGTSYSGASLNPPGGNKVPVENCGTSSPAGCGAGTINSHWREPVFDNELMTGYISVGVNPLSAMTVAAQGDLGYKVNYDAADTYTHAFAVPVAGGAARVFLQDDIRRGPIYFVDSFGRVVGVRQR